MRASSDVNILVVLDRLDVDRLNGVAELIQMAAAAVELHPMFMLFAELPLAAEAFAVKFDDIAHRHTLLYGVDPFPDLVIPPAILIGRIRQVLLNLTLRARTSYAVNRDRETALAVAVADAAAPLRRSAHAILEMRGSRSASPKESLSVWSEEHFVGRVLHGTRAPLLLDLHNLYANAWNFGRDPIAQLHALPLGEVRSVHLSGGCVVRDEAGVARLVDDHLHDPPDVVFDLLQVLAANATCGLTVILERDGRFPDFSAVLRQLALARAALARGRGQQSPARSAAA